jgi:hypothetical protein
MFLSIALIATGCIGSDVAKWSKELANDNSTVVGNVGTVYGTMRVIRTNPRPEHSVTIHPDGSVSIAARPLEFPSTAPEGPLFNVDGTRTEVRPK